ncbi:MAG: copper chaperone PCu(A)C [Gammaproteobacteria bacterium]
MLLALGLPGVALAAVPVGGSHAWIRWLPGQIPLAGYVTLHNNGSRARTIVGASSPAFKRVELHRSMTTKNGMETMKAVAAVTIPAKGKFSFAPGGYHLMLWRKHPIQVDEKLPIVFEFKNGSRLRVVFTVKGATQ